MYKHWPPICQMRQEAHGELVDRKNLLHRILAKYHLIYQLKISSMNFQLADQPERRILNVVRWLVGLKVSNCHQSLKVSDKTVYSLDRYFYLLGFIMSKNNKRFVFLYSKRKFSIQPLRFCWHNKTQKKGVSNKSINFYQTLSLLTNQWL